MDYSGSWVGFPCPGLNSYGDLVNGGETNAECILHNPLILISFALFHVPEAVLALLSLFSAQCFLLC